MKDLIVALLLSLACSDAARILAFYPFQPRSHHYFFRPILAALGKRGHDVVYYTGYPYEGEIPPGVTQVDVSKEMVPLSLFKSQVNLSDQTILHDVIYMFEVGSIIAPNMVGTPSVQKLIHSKEKFDAVLMESYVIQEYESALIHKFGAVGIETIPVGDFSWVNELAGIPDNPAYQLDYKAQLTQELNFRQRLYNTYISVVTSLVGYYYMTRYQRVMDKYFNYTGWESRPPIVQLLSNRSLILCNYHYIVGYPAPLPPHRKDVGGAHMPPNKPLQKDIQDFMDGSRDGVILFSLGSNINVSDPAIKTLSESFIKVFSEIPQRVLMKWEVQYPGELPKNVQIRKWLPQQDILAHKNCKLFITHCGYLSLTEAVHHGVPLIGIPFFGDQPKNALFLESAGLGKMLKPNNVNYNTAYFTVNELLSNKRYKEEAERRSRIFRNRQFSPVEEAVYWIEHAIKYPNVLTPKGTSLSFFQLHLIDVQLFIVTTLIAISLMLWKLISFLRIVNRKQQKIKRS